jgi:hypothetical protein
MKTSVVIVDAVSPGQPSLLYSFQILLLSMVSHSCNLKYSEAGALQKFKASLSYRICSRPVRADLSSQLKKKKKGVCLTESEKLTRSRQYEHSRSHPVPCVSLGLLIAPKEMI